MKYDFDKVINRRNTNSLKWDTKEKDILPMWVADMDFKAPLPVIEALKNRVEQGVFGYSRPNHSYFDAAIEWFKTRHDWEIQKQWIILCPGVVPAIKMLIKALTQPNDKVILQTPVYYPFYSSITDNEREIVENPLKYKDGRYYMDFEDLDIKTKDPKVKILILCSPHNPTGRVWTKGELTRLGDICVKNKVIVISDEIHCDLIYEKHKHTPFALISEEFNDITITCNSPSKTFNLAGLQISNVIIKNEAIREKFKMVSNNNGLWGANLLGLEAAEAAYLYGTDWLDQLLPYIESNLKFLISYVEKNIPSVKVIIPEGTYLIWLDFRKFKITPQELHNLLIENGRIWLDEGFIFGNAGQGFERINIACPHCLLEEGLNRIKGIVDSLQEL